MSLTCITCTDANIEEVVEGNKRYFFCRACNQLYERAVDSTYGRDLSINTDQGVVHVVASAVIHKDDKCLLIKRRSFPFGYSFPGGHLEYAETPMATISREIFEELGLQLLQAELIFEGKIDITKCRYGADSHYWYLYRCRVEDNPVVLNPESESADWFTYKEALELDLTPSARHIFETILEPHE